MKLESINKKILVVWGAISFTGLSEIRQRGNLVMVPENRPFLLGVKHNIPLLKREGIGFIYCPDNALGLLFYKEKIERTLLFYCEKNEKGIKGICGSLYITLLSKLHKVPVEIIEETEVEWLSLDKDAATLEGKNFVIAENREEYIIKAEKEVVPWEILK
jgi:methylthioribose-1-phosphate isomerase